MGGRDPCVLSLFASSVVEDVLTINDYKILVDILKERRGVYLDEYFPLWEDQLAAAQWLMNHGAEVCYIAISGRYATYEICKRFTKSGK